MLVTYLPAVVVSFILGSSFLFILKKLALKHRFLMPKQVPLVGGISVGLSLILVYLSAGSLGNIVSKESLGLIVSLMIILVSGIVDDWRELSIKAKFIIQLVAASVLIISGVRTHIVYIGDFLNIIVTLIWVIGITNAFNFLDVVDGVAGSIALIVSVAFAIISFLSGNVNTFLLALALSGGLVSFLIYNLPPAKLYLGNSGSHFLGFLFAAVAIMISYAPLDRKIALLSPLLILGLPLFDAVFLIFTRIRKGKLPFKKSKDHIALRFLALGYSVKKVLLLMVALGLFFSLNGLALSRVSNIIGLSIIMFVLLISFILTLAISKIVVYD